MSARRTAKTVPTVEGAREPFRVATKLFMSVRVSEPIRRSPNAG
ncbi:hypothetical protein ACIBQ1_50820 [Nonomuraea sp. NPDC050153]